MIVDNTQVLLQALEAGELDFVLVEGFFDRERYETRLYRREAFFGVCPPGHRLAGRAVPLDELTENGSSTGKPAPEHGPSLRRRAAAQLYPPKL